MTGAIVNGTVTGLGAFCLLAASVLSANVQAAANPELDAARQELRLRTETERRMREDFESLLAKGRMSATEITDFENYLARLSGLVDEQRRIVAELEGRDPRGAPRSAPLPEDFNRGQTDQEKIAMLDAQLGNSLSEFDEKLLREQKELAEKSRAASTGDEDGSQGSGGVSGNGAEGAGAEGEGAQGEDRQSEGEAGGASGESGSESESAESREGDASGQQAGAEDGGDADSNNGEGNDQVAAVGEAGRHAGETTRPPDIGDGKDDDIVARQLREAAENEQDPELREKLWEEYRKYKKRTP